MRKILVILFLLVTLYNSSFGATLYYAGTSNNWDTGTTSDWGTQSGGPYGVVWSAGSSAYFEGSGGSTALVSAVTVSNINWGANLTKSWWLTGTGGTITVAAGSVLWTNMTSQAGTISATIANSSTLTIGGAGVITLNGIISGSGALVYGGSGTLTLTGNNSYTGTTTVNQGVLNVTGSITTSSAIIIAAGATLNSTGVNKLTQGNWTLAGTLNKTDGSGQDITSSITLNNGTLSGSVDFAAWGTYNLTGNYTITANGSANTINAVRLGMNSGVRTFNTPGATDVLRISSILGASSAISGGLIKTGSGLLILSGSGSYTGGTTLTGGILNVGTTTALGAAASTITFNGGTLQAGANNLTLGNSTIVLSSGGGVVDTQANTFTLTSVISGSGSLTKVGAGTLTLSGANTYTAGTTISAGVINTGSSTTLGSGTITFNGGTLNANQTTTFGNALSITGSQAYIGAASGKTLTLNGTLSSSGGGITIFNPGNVTFQGTNASYSSGWNIVAGGLAFGSLTNVSMGVAGQTLTFSGSGSITPFNFNGQLVPGFSTCTVNAGVTGAILPSTYNSWAFGTLTGSGTLNVGAGNGNSTMTFTNAYGFTGTLGVTSGSGSAPSFNFGTLSDSGGNLLFFAASVVGPASFTLFNDMGSLTFNTRQIELAGACASAATLVNNNPTAANAWYINTNLKNGATAAKTLSLAGSNAGSNTFAGLLPDASAANILSLSKSGAGWWYVTGNNSFTGSVTVSAGTLTMTGVNQYTNQTVISGGQLVVPTIASNGVACAVGNGATGIPIEIGGNGASPTLIYTGAGQATDRQIMFGYTGNSSGGTILNNGTGALNFTAPTFLVNTVGGTAGAKICTFGGSYGGTNIIQGIIPNFGTMDYALSISSGNIWQFNGANTWTGGVTVTGTLLASNMFACGKASLGAAGTVTVGGTLTILSPSLYIGTLSGTGTINASSGATSLVLTQSTASTYSGWLMDGGGTLSLTMLGTGTNTLNSGTSTFTGQTVIDMGILIVTNWNNAGVASCLGAPTGANSVINIGNGGGLSILAANNADQTGNRVINLFDTGAGSSTLTINGASSTLTSAITITGTGAKTLNIGVGLGSGGDGKTFTIPGIPDASDNSPTSVSVNIQPQTATNPSFLVLNATNTFSGVLSMTSNQGTLNAVKITGSGVLESGNFTNNVVVGTGCGLYYQSTADQTFSGIISGVGSFSKSVGTGSTIYIANTNTITGQLILLAGTMTLNSGGGFTGSPVLGVYAGSVLSIGNGSTLTVSQITLGSTSGTSFLNQSGGLVTITGGLGLLMGAGSPSGIYNMSGGTLTSTQTGLTRGILLGVNTGAATNYFNLSGGTVYMPKWTLQVGRDDGAANNSTNTWNQTGGSATFGSIGIGGGANGGTISATLKVTGGSFVATNWVAFGGITANTCSITIGGTGSVQLPAFPASSGGNTYLTFDGGTLVAGSSSATYISAGTFTTATITANGANIDSGANDITISQVFTGLGGINKWGTGSLTINGNNSNTGKTTINAGWLNAGTVNALGTVPKVYLNAGTLNFASGYTNNAASEYLYGNGGTLVGNLVCTNGGLVVGGITDAQYTPNILSQTGTLEFDTGGNMAWIAVATNNTSQINITGNLVIGATASNPATITLYGSNGTGICTNFNPALSQTWTLTKVSGSISGYAKNSFVINSAPFATGNILTGSFYVTTNANSLLLGYTSSAYPLLYWGNTNAPINLGHDIYYIYGSQRTPMQ